MWMLPLYLHVNQTSDYDDDDETEDAYSTGLPLMWMLPLYLHVDQKSDYDDDDETEDAYSTWSLTNVLCQFFDSLILVLTFLLMKLRVLFALPVMLFI